MWFGDPPRNTNNDLVFFRNTEQPPSFRPYFEKPATLKQSMPEDNKITCSKDKHMVISMKSLHDLEPQHSDTGEHYFFDHGEDLFCIDAKTHDWVSSHRLPSQSCYMLYLPFLTKHTCSAGVSAFLPTFPSWRERWRI